MRDLGEGGKAERKRTNGQADEFVCILCRLRLFAGWCACVRIVAANLVSRPEFVMRATQGESGSARLLHSTLRRRSLSSRELKTENDNKHTSKIGAPRANTPAS